MGSTIRTVGLLGSECNTSGGIWSLCGTFTFGAILYFSVYTQYIRNIQLILPEQHVP